MKRIIIILSVCLSLLLTGCGETNEDRGYAVSDAAVLLDTDGVFTGKMEEVDTEIAAMIYGIDYATVSEATCHMAINSSVSADEISVWVLTDETAAQSAEQSCQTRLESQIDSYTNYCPDQVPKLEEAMVDRIGNTVLLAVGETEALVPALESLK